MTDQVEYNHHAELKSIKKQVETFECAIVEKATQLDAAQTSMTSLVRERGRLLRDVVRLERQYKTEGSM